jgi:hypothetical protein
MHFLVLQVKLSCSIGGQSLKWFVPTSWLIVNLATVCLFVCLFVFLALQPIVVEFSKSSSGPPRVRGFLITHNDAPQSVGLLWTSDQSVAETST